MLRLSLAFTIFSLGLTQAQFLNDKPNLSKDRCLALVLKGGANKGSYEAGAIYAFVRNLPQKDVEWDVVSGISVGALNAAHVATYEVGQEYKMSEEMIQMWTNFTQDSLYQSWNWGVLQGLLFEKSLYDTHPLHEFIRQYFSTRSISRKIHINSVDANTGDVVTFDETTPKEDFMIGLQGSAAVPFLFPPVPYKDHVLIDGGVAWNLDITSAIHKCRELVDSDDKIVIDVIDVDRSSNLIPNWDRSGTTISNYLRYQAIQGYYKRIDDLQEVQWAFPDVKYRYIVSPSVSLDPFYKELSLDQGLIQKMINMGMDDAIRTIQKDVQL